MRFVSHNYLEVLNYDISENRDLTDPEQIEKALKLGEYIKQGELLWIYNELILMTDMILRNTCPLLVAEISTFEALLPIDIRYLKFKFFIKYGRVRAPSIRTDLRLSSNERAYSSSVSI